MNPLLTSLLLSLQLLSPLSVFADFSVIPASEPESRISSTTPFIGTRLPLIAATLGNTTTLSTTTTATFNTIGNQSLGSDKKFSIIFNSTSIPNGSTIQLSTINANGIPFGNIYPSSFTKTANSMSLPVYITSTLGNTTIRATYNNATVANSNQFFITPPCTSTLQNFDLEGLCTPKNPNLANPREISPGTATSPGTVVSSPSTTFTWTPVNGATKYALYVRNLTNLDSNGNGTLIIDNENVTSTSFSYSYLQPNSKYKWNVRAKDASGLGGWLSDSYYFTTGSFTAPADPNLAGAVSIQVLDSSGFPVENAEVSYQCYSVDPKACEGINIGQHVTKTDPLGIAHYHETDLGKLPGVQVNIKFFDAVKNQYITKSAYVPSLPKVGSPTTYITTWNYQPSSVSVESIANGWALVISVAPVSGEIYDSITLISGKDPRSGDPLNDFTRGLTIVGLASGVGSGKVAREIGTAAVARIATEAGTDIDSAMDIGEALFGQIPMATHSDMKNLVAKGPSVISEIVQNIRKYTKLGKLFETLVNSKIASKDPATFSQISNLTGKTTAQLSNRIHLTQVQLNLKGGGYVVLDDVLLLTEGPVGAQTYKIIANETKLGALTSLSQRQKQLLSELQGGANGFTVRSAKFGNILPQTKSVTIETYVKTVSNGTGDTISSITKMY